MSTITNRFGVDWRVLADRVEAKWPGWTEREPALGEVTGLEELREALSSGADPARANVLLGALVRLGAVSGWDDVDAATAAAFFLERGSVALQSSLRSLSDDIEAMVAGAVWMQVREYPVHRRNAVAKNVLLDARRRVLNDLGVRRPDRSLREIPTEMTPEGCRVIDAAAVAADQPARASELAGVLEWATAERVISKSAADLLLDLVAASVGAEVRSGSLNTRAVMAKVAAAHGLSCRTAQRRRDDAVAALRQARCALTDVA